MQPPQIITLHLLLLAAVVSTSTTHAFLSHYSPPAAPAPASAASTARLGRRLSTSTLCTPKQPSLRSLAAYEDDREEDLTERSVSLLTQLAKALNKDVPVPTFLVPPRASDVGRVRASVSSSITTIKGWFPLSMGVALILGNPVYPAAFVGFLYLSRPIDAPDVAAALAAALLAGVVNPLLVSFADDTGLDDTFLARFPFLVGAAATFYVLAQVLTEGKEVFQEVPRREEKARVPGLKQERDLRFFDVKMKNKDEEGGGEANLTVEVTEKRDESESKGRWREDE
eukprot:evm.model.NODE_5801_length_40303_cov_26.021786.8